VLFAPGLESQESYAAIGEADGFVARFTAGGELVWVRRLTGDGFEGVTRITGLQESGVLVSGLFFEDAVLGGGSAGDQELVAAASSDALAARFTVAGDADWTAVSGGTWQEEAFGVAQIASGPSVVVGEHWGDLFYGESDPLLGDPVGWCDAYVVLLGSGGGALDAFGIGGLGAEAAVDVDATADGLVVVGSFQDTAQFGIGTPNPVERTATKGAENQTEDDWTSDGYVMKLVF
jgi:hypothetical protein